jgi:hypothetical protein
MIDKPSLWAGIYIGLVIGMILSAFITGYTSYSIWEKKCIDKGYAEYNQTNGQWQWKERSE